jgi:hypothetical protein
MAAGPLQGFSPEEMERLRNEYASYDPKKTYAMPSPTGSLTAAPPANPLDRLAQQVTDSDYFRKLSPEAQKVISGTGQLAEMAPPVAAARGGYDIGAGAASGDYGQVVQGAVNALPEVGPAAKTAMFLPIGVAGTNWGAVAEAKKAFKKGASITDPGAVGALHDEVWRKTGMGVLPEGKMFFEVPDVGLQVDPARGWQHPELWQADPNTKNIQVAQFTNPQKSELGGFYVPSKNTIAYNTAADPKSYPGGPREIVSHEIQHPIQNWYGLSEGASPQDVLGPTAQAYERDVLADAIKRGVDVRGINPGELAYHGASGEDFARNVQTRRNMTMPDLRDEHPRHTSDLLESGLPRLIYGGDRMLRKSPVSDKLAQLWDIYGYGSGP